MTEQQQEILRRIAEGESLRAVCRSPGMPAPSTVVSWCADPEFDEQYTRATNMRADVYFDRLDDVSDEAVEADSGIKVQGLRLKADNIKWQLARMAPKKYGDKLDLNHSGEMRFTRIEKVVVKPA